MIRCRDCGHEVKDGLSFCPNCGADVNYRIVVNSRKKKPLPAWAIVLIVCTIGFWVWVIGNARVVDSSESSQTTEESTTVTTVSSTTTLEQYATPIPRSASINEIGFDEFIERYNEYADSDYQISSDMISQGAYSSQHWVYFNDCSIEFSENRDIGIIIDFRGESADDTTMTLLFRYCCKAFVNELSDDEIDSILDELRTGNYMYYDFYQFNGLQATYSNPTLLSNGEYRFSITLKPV
ncbi:MAG: zinc ribbon domain-containing protein [Clostridiales bacterium]|nr:zinc ribbon domain-containing protein [Clostridiales bacterium]